MSRPKKFSRLTVLNQAMYIFWEKGYFETSIEDIVNTTKVSRYGLYDEFDSKYGIFLEALEFYSGKIIFSRLNKLKELNATRHAISEYIMEFFCSDSSSASKFGCLLCNISGEVVPHNESIKAISDQHRLKLISGFRNALCSSVEKGSLPSQLNTDAAATCLTGVMYAASVFCRSKADVDYIRQFIKHAVEGILCIPIIPERSNQIIAHDSL